MGLESRRPWAVAFLAMLGTLLQGLRLSKSCGFLGDVSNYFRVRLPACSNLLDATLL